jgi:hypothetical protein
LQLHASQSAAANEGAPIALLIRKLRSGTVRPGSRAAVHCSADRGLGHEPPLDACTVLDPLVLPGACAELRPVEDVLPVVDVPLVAEVLVVELALAEERCEAPRSTTKAPVPTAAAVASVIVTARTRERLDLGCGDTSGRQPGGGVGAWNGSVVDIAPPLIG